LEGVLEPFDFSGLPQFEPAQRTPVDSVLGPQTTAVGEKIIAYFLSDKSELPAFPALAMRILEVSRQPDVNMNKFVTVVSQDPAIAARILRVANSPFYASISEITSTRDAVVRIGLKDVAALVSAASSGALFDSNKGSRLPGFSEAMHRLWLSSMTCAFAAGHLSMQLRKGASDRSFLGGMLHDVGKMVALRVLNELLEKDEITLAFSGNGGLSELQIRAILEEIHLRLGLEAISTWDLPDFLMEICLEHHGASIAATPDREDLHIVRVVSGLNAMSTDPFHPTRLGEEVEESARALGLRPRRLGVLVNDIREFAQKAQVLSSGGR
jgi:HD-like signal output (HDOD) protein